MEEERVYGKGKDESTCHLLHVCVYNMLNVTIQMDENACGEGGVVFLLECTTRQMSLSSLSLTINLDTLKACKKFICIFTITVRF